MSYTGGYLLQNLIQHTQPCKTDFDSLESGIKMDHIHNVTGDVISIVIARECRRRRGGGGKCGRRRRRKEWRYIALNT